LGSVTVKKMLTERRCHHLEKGDPFDSKRYDWGWLENFAHTYDGEYDKLVESRVAEKLDYAVWQDINTTIVQTEAEGYGRKMRYSLLHP
jgi:hypothetical protein